MTREFFYAPPSAVSGSDIVLEGDELRHLVHVMRRKEGDGVLIVDGTGTTYDTVIRSLTRSSARCEILRQRREERTQAVILGVGVLKNPARFDFLVEKTTEAGVTSIVPLRTARTIPRHAREERWQKLALAAMKQSGRSFLPAVAPLTGLEEFLHSGPPEALRLCAHEEAATPITQLLPRHGRPPLLLCIGPEGGFSPEEVRLAAGAGFQTISLGRYRLRTETAAIVATALCALAAAEEPGG